MATEARETDAVVKAVEAAAAAEEGISRVAELRRRQSALRQHWQQTQSSSSSKFSPTQSINDWFGTVLLVTAMVTPTKLSHAEPD